MTRPRAAVFFFALLLSFAALALVQCGGTNAPPLIADAGADRTMPPDAAGVDTGPDGEADADGGLDQTSPDAGTDGSDDSPSSDSPSSDSPSSDSPSSDSPSSDSPSSDSPSSDSPSSDSPSSDAWEASSSDAMNDGPSDGGTLEAEAGVQCDPTHPCSMPLTCCSNACVDTTRDPHNCGTCGNACTANQFCTSAAIGDGASPQQCSAAVFANLCANPQAAVALDLYTGDNEAGIALGTALATSCSPAVTVRQVSQFQNDIVDQDAGRPNAGAGTTLIAGGGAFGQHTVAYMEQAQLSPIYLVSNGTNAQYINRASGAVVVATAVSALTDQHDYFFLELSVEPKSGTLCFFGAGILGPGTVAAGYYGAAQLVPNHTGDMHSWYAVEWTDTNGDKIPNAGDTFGVIGQGP